MRKIILLFCILLFALSCGEKNEPLVWTGLDRIDRYTDLFRDKRIGLVTNHTSYTHDNRHSIDHIAAMPDVQITALFGPEHGIRGKEAAGHRVSDTTDATSQIPVYSLYGVVRKPTPEMMASVDLLVFDIQDIGARFYTYMSTMALSMEAAAETGKPFIVLDRPNPINGISVEGNILEPDFASFVGMFPIPARHGLTAGELAVMINSEGWLKEGVKANLKVIKMEGWERRMWYDQTGLIWRPPSPNMPDLAVATVYPGTCLFEGTNVSEGRGTYRPFLLIGAPWFGLENFDMINRILDLPGLHMGPVTFVPRSIISMAPHPEYLGKTITGLSLAVTDRDSFRPYLAGIALVKYMHDANPAEFNWRKGHFDRLCGTDRIRAFISEGKPLETIAAWIDKDLQSFLPLRKRYLLY